MYRIRFHGRGGQGMKTASRILGTAFFLEGFTVQDAPRYGAERRGAPIFAYVRASREVINERGIICNPDLIVVADDTLMGLPAAGVMSGAGERTVLLVGTTESADVWKERLNFPGTLLVMHGNAGSTDRMDHPDGDRIESRFAGATCNGAAARLLDVISRAALERAIREELGFLAAEVLRKNIESALHGFDLMASHAGCVTEDQGPLPDSAAGKPNWIDLPFDDARISAPVIHSTATTEYMKTGLWRTMRPVIDTNRCRRCWWVCSTLCPDGAISVTGEGFPRIDYDHCKGCMICVAQCPSHAIRAVPEHEAQQQEAQHTGGTHSTEGGRP